MLIDSHCHLDCLDLDRFDGGLDGVLANARTGRPSTSISRCRVANGTLRDDSSR